MAATGKKMRPCNQRGVGKEGKKKKWAPLTPLEVKKIQSSWKISTQPHLGFWGLFRQKPSTLPPGKWQPVEVAMLAGGQESQLDTNFPCCLLGFSLSLSSSPLSSLNPKVETTDLTCPTELDISTMIKCFTAGAKFSVHCKEGICDGNNSFSNNATARTWRWSGCSWISVLSPVIQASNTSSCWSVHKVQKWSPAGNCF